MSEKRFERWNDHSCNVKDNQENTLLKWEDVIHKLNEQQATNSALMKENNHLIDVIKEYAKKYGEQQATITELERKLKKYEKIGEEQLKQIIELQDEINDCEKFRYTVFKRIGELVE